jgi:hypothetical protein
MLSDDFVDAGSRGSCGVAAETAQLRITAQTPPTARRRLQIFFRFESIAAINSAPAPTIEATRRPGLTFGDRDRGESEHSTAAQEGGYDVEAGAICLMAKIATDKGVEAEAAPEG